MKDRFSIPSLLLFYIITNTAIPLDYLLNEYPIIQSALVYSKWITFAYLFVKFINCKNLKDKSKQIYFLISFSLIYIVYLMSTLLNGGNLQQWFSSLYCNLSHFFFFSIALTSGSYCNNFFKWISRFYLYLTSLNLFLILAGVSFFLETNGDAKGYLYGPENYVIYPLIIGLLYNILNDHYNIGQKIYYYIYIVEFVLTIFLIWSGTTVIGSIILLIFLYSPLKSFLTKINFTIVFSGLVLGELFLVVLSGISFESRIITYVVENFLGKDLTFSSRTLIWEVVLSNIAMHPILGFGFPDTVNLFSYYDGLYETYTSNFSTHNEYLFMLYKGGIMAMISLLLCIRKLVRHFNLYHYDKACLIYAFLVSISVLYFGEAPKMDHLFEIIFIGYLLPLSKSIHSSNVQKY